MKNEIKKLLIENKLFSILFTKKLTITTILHDDFDIIYLVKLNYNSNCDNNIFFDKQCDEFINELTEYLKEHINIECDIKINVIYYANIFIIHLLM